MHAVAWLNKNFVEAKEYFKKSLEFYPNSLTPKYNLSQIYLREFSVNTMLLLKGTDSMIHKNASTLFLISCLKIFTRRRRNHTLSKLKPTAKLIKKQVLKPGTSMSTETKVSFSTYSMDNTNQL